MTTGPLRKALITGICGQDGRLLTRHLSRLGYTVVGTTRPEDLHSGLLEEFGSQGVSVRPFEKGHVEPFFEELLSTFEPDEIYHLAAPSFVPDSWRRPFETTHGVAGPLDQFIQYLRAHRTAALFYASSSEVFGRKVPNIYDEHTPHSPVSPYGCSKSHVQQVLRLIRDQEKLGIVTGILFNHESHLRPQRFVTMKICSGLQHFRESGKPIELGNLSSSRDWGCAHDFVRSFQELTSGQHWGEFVIATGRLLSVRDFVTAAANHMNMAIEWVGTGAQEEAIEVRSKRVVVKVNPEFYREHEPEAPRGSPEKLRRTLGWAPDASIERLIRSMFGDLG